MKGMSTYLKDKVYQFLHSYPFIDNLRIQSFVSTVWNKINLEKRIRRVYPLADIKSYKNHIQRSLNGSFVFNSHAPKAYEESKRISPVQVTELNLYRFEEALINPRSSAILYRNKILYDRIHPDEGFNEGFLIFNGRKNALLLDYKREVIEKGLFMGGLGYWNWYHWLIEILPRVLFINQETKVLLLPSKIKDNVNMWDSLCRIVDISSHEIIWLAEDINYMVKTLFYINHINYVPFYFLRKKTQLSVNDVFLRKEVLYDLKYHLTKTIKANRHPNPKRILFGRRGHRLAGNQAELVSLAQDYGFTEIFMEDYNLDEQIQLMQGAEVVAGITGAAWTNIIFMQPGTQAICFLPRSAQNFSCYSNLAEIFRVDMVSFFYDASSYFNDHAASGFVIDLQRFKKLLDKIIR